jgi:hypothetical protein
VHGDHSTLDGRQVTLQKGSVQPDPHHRGRSVVSEGRARSEVHLLRPWDPEAHVSMSVRGDCSAGHYPLGDVDHLITKRSGRAAPGVRSTLVGKVTEAPIGDLDSINVDRYPTLPLNTVIRAGEDDRCANVTTITSPRREPEVRASQRWSNVKLSFQSNLVTKPCYLVA